MLDQTPSTQLLGWRSLTIAISAGTKPQNEAAGFAVGWVALLDEAAIAEKSPATD